MEPEDEMNSKDVNFKAPQEETFEGTSEHNEETDQALLTGFLENYANREIRESINTLHELSEDDTLPKVLEAIARDNSSEARKVKDVLTDCITRTLGWYEGTYGNYDFERNIRYVGIDQAEKDLAFIESIQESIRIHPSIRGFGELISKFRESIEKFKQLEK
jgi:hypothetical protein